MKERKQHPTDTYKHNTNQHFKKKVNMPKKNRKKFSYQKLNLTTLINYTISNNLLSIFNILLFGVLF